MSDQQWPTFHSTKGKDSAVSSTATELVRKTEAFVKQELSGNDGSHDFHHIDRVRCLALSLCDEEGIKDREAVELAALLHDVKDWKYSGSETAGVDAARSFLQANMTRPDAAAQIDKIVRIIAHIGFKSELGNLEQKSKETSLPEEFGVVQDADRLDAIGAIGIARTFTYGGSRNRALFEPDRAPVLNISKEEYMTQKDSPTINHFYEKLLRLRGMMKTAAGKRRAQHRHDYMEGFLREFYAEWQGQA